MRASQQEQTGAAGIHEVMAKFERIGWAPHQTEALHDLGSDLIVAVRDERRFELGLGIAAQVKSGDSCFTSMERDSDGEVVGWWYYENETDHFDYWVNSFLPHLLVFHDLDANRSYWVHVTAERIERVGKGCKILVPAAHVIDQEHLDDLVEVALQRGAWSVEGTAFSAAARNISPGRRLRFALIAPRLVAPHRNRGHSDPITPEEGIALIAQGRFGDLKLFSEQHAAVPDPSDESGSSDWRWQFVHALWRWGIHDDIAPLQKSVLVASDEPSRAAATAVLACALMREERLEEAITLLDDSISNDQMSPVDHAWMLVQRSRLRADRGETGDARDDAVLAQRSLMSESDDVTASALAAAASWQLFSAAGVTGGDLAQVLTANDTMVSWWRSQTMSWALNEASMRVFREWAEDKTHRWSFEDSESMNLFAAELNADLTGEHGAWKSISALSARHRLMTAPLTDEEAVAIGLDALRKSGVTESLKLAVGRFRTSGPIAGVARAVNRVSDAPWTRTTALNNFKFWRAAGDLVEPAVATHAALWCIDLVRDPSILNVQLSLTFWVDLEAAEALASLLSAADPEAHQATAALLVERNDVPDVLKPTFARVVSLLQLEHLSEATVEKLWDFACANDDVVAAELLGSLAINGHEGAKEELLRRSSGKDLHALAALGPITALDDESAEGLVVEFETRVRAMIESAEKGSYGFGGSDPAHGLTIFNHWFPEVARWDTLVNFLTNTAVAGEHKHSACQTIVALGDRLSPEVRESIGASLDGLRATENREFLPGKKVGGLAEAVGIAVGAISGPAADETVARLALGTPAERSQVADLLGYGYSESMRPLLASLSVDQRSDVRMTAINAVGRLVTRHSDKMLMALSERFANDSSEGVPKALLNGILSAEKPISRELRELVEKLVGHPSAIIRSAARRALAQ